MIISGELRLWIVMYIVFNHQCVFMYIVLERNYTWQMDIAVFEIGIWDKNFFFSFILFRLLLNLIYPYVYLWLKINFKNRLLNFNSFSELYFPVNFPTTISEKNVFGRCTFMKVGNVLVPTYMNWYEQAFEVWSQSYKCLNLIL